MVELRCGGDRAHEGGVGRPIGFGFGYHEVSVSVDPHFDGQCLDSGPDRPPDAAAEELGAGGGGQDAGARRGRLRRFLARGQQAAGFASCHTATEPATAAPAAAISSGARYRVAAQTRRGGSRDDGGYARLGARGEERGAAHADCLHEDDDHGHECACRHDHRGRVRAGEVREDEDPRSAARRHGRRAAGPRAPRRCRGAVVVGRRPRRRWACGAEHGPSARLRAGNGRSSPRCIPVGVAAEAVQAYGAGGQAGRPRGLHAPQHGQPLGRPPRGGAARREGPLRRLRERGFDARATLLPASRRRAERRAVQAAHGVVGHVVRHARRPPPLPRLRARRRAPRAALRRRPCQARLDAGAGGHGHQRLRVRSRAVHISGDIRCAVQLAQHPDGAIWHCVLQGAGLAPRSRRLHGMHPWLLALLEGEDL
mmetsp:Transcript_130268/g.324807  ORF Transcript_130268/g.324807 Transcript_130268/m.324807 type:complete len:425 (+) Transcript_130268:159-1433(+)